MAKTNGRGTPCQKCCSPCIYSVNSQKVYSYNALQGVKIFNWYNYSPRWRYRLPAHINSIKSKGKGVLQCEVLFPFCIYSVNRDQFSSFLTSLTNLSKKSQFSFPSPRFSASMSSSLVSQMSPTRILDIIDEQLSTT